MVCGHKQNSQSLANQKQKLKTNKDMKTKIFALFAAMMLLVGTTAMAQSDDTKNTSTTETSLKGDVNCDGVVDVADIAAVIAVMHEQGTIETKYYWYVGSMTEANALNPQTLGNIVNGKNATSSTTGISTLNIPNDAANECIVFVYPEIWGRPDITDSTGFGTGDMYYKDEGFELPTGYNATVWSGDAAIKGKTLNITWTK